MLARLRKPDTFGAFASSLCLVHCIATPFFFVAQTCSVSCCATSVTPVWWTWIDYFFLIISFFTVYQSTKTTSKNWIKPAFWATWVALSFVIMNERFLWLNVFEGVIYIPTLTLIGLHLYNLKFCQCESKFCVKTCNS